jgi:hypothetical protein
MIISVDLPVLVNWEGTLWFPVVLGNRYIPCKERIGSDGATETRLCVKESGAGVAEW